MILPPGKTEAEVLEAIELAVNSAAQKHFVFGYFLLDDIKQQARLFALEALGRYDPARPLVGFLYVHVKNRLINFYRDEYRRNDPPCKTCHSAGTCERASGRKFCGKYQGWYDRNTAKSNLMRPVDIGHILEETEPCFSEEGRVEEAAVLNECLALIDEKLPADCRADYLRMREGIKLPKDRRVHIEGLVKEILQWQNEES